MYIILKEIAYTISAESDAEAEQVAKEVQSELCEKFDEVSRYPNGSCCYRVIARDTNDVCQK
jgi:hypothetical protein